MKKYFCDRCRCEITDDIRKISFGILEGEQINTDPLHEDIEQELDFCAECAAELYDMILARCGIKAVNYPENLEELLDPSLIQKRVKKRKTKKVDAGKIWALKDAGWNASSIALEVGCSTATVYKTLNKDRPEMEV